LAAYVNGDVIGKTVLDLGCGTGRLGLGAAFLGAKMVLGVDVDKAAVALAAGSARSHKLRANTDWVAGDLEVIAGEFDTVLQNPPFGVQKRGADRKFLEKALEVGSSVYSLHNHPRLDEQLFQRLKGNRSVFLRVEASPFIERFVEKRGGSIVAVYALLMTIPRMFSFHTKLRHDFVVDLYVIKKKG
jgi:putative methylase